MLVLGWTQFEVCMQKPLTMASVSYLNESVVDLLDF